MDAEEFRRLRTLFDRLAELPPQERSAGLDREVTLGEATRRHLRALLDADVALEGMTARPVLAGQRPLRDSAQWIGCRVGAFVVESELGRGGMGSVFLAHRADGSVEQRVALKLIRPERLDEHTLARFRLERQVLALLKHPNIAALHDLGELDDGTPYVVMEYVEGQPITEFARDRQLDLKQRLRLFLDVCDAVSYAHRSMIVHRDLKPSNILVTAEGQSKLLDFGIAKPLLARFGTQDIQETGAAQRYFSPYNAAPEQLRGEPITVACDVYGLGILLYELLAQAAPFDFTGKTPGQIEQLILETEPLAPSARLPARAHSLRGDLDAIVLRALRKNPDQRYATVDQLVDDIQRYLEGRPVEARKGHAWYRLRKFAGRNRVALSATAIIFVLLTAAGIALWSQVLETIRQRDRAQRAMVFLVDAFRAADPERALGEVVTAKQILDQAQRTLNVEATKDPELQIELLARIAEIKIHLSAYQEALDAVNAAFQRINRSPDTHDDIRAELFELRARALHKLDDYKGAQAALDEAEKHSPSLRTQLVITDARARLMIIQGETIKLKEYVEHAMQYLLPKLDDADPLKQTTAIGLAEALWYVDEPRGTTLLEAMLRTTLAGLPTGHPLVLKAKRLLSKYYNGAGRNEEAERLSRSIKEPIEKLYGADSLAAASVSVSLGNALVGEGKSLDAMAQFKSALRIDMNALGPKHANVTLVTFDLATVETDAKLWDDAERDYRTSIKSAKELWPKENENATMFTAAYALMLNLRHRYTDAIPLFQEVVGYDSNDPDFQKGEVYTFSAMGLALDRFALDPSEKNRKEFEQCTDAANNATPDLWKSAGGQLELAKTLGLAVPVPAAKAGAESKGK